MSERNHHRLHLLISLLALVCASAATFLYGQAPPSNSSLTTLSSKKASKLLVDQSPPKYPALARVNYIQGHVKVELEVARDGKVAQAHAVEGHPILAAAAIKALRSWTYRPLETSSGPAGFLTTVLVKFSLHNRNAEEVPREAESDLSRQVHPPVMTDRPTTSGSANVVHMRLLVNDDGHVIDSDPAPRTFANPLAALKALEEWKFLPAHWGTLPIPWYVDTVVPITTALISHGAGQPGGR